MSALAPASRRGGVGTPPRLSRGWKAGRESTPLYYTYNIKYPPVSWLLLSAYL